MGCFEAFLPTTTKLLSLYPERARRWQKEQSRDWWSGRLAGGDDRRVKEVR